MVLKGKPKKALWSRELSCGHKRLTDVSFSLGQFEKPKVLSSCYCRECLKERIILRVRKVPVKEAG